jgi:hypothetical protein
MGGDYAFGVVSLEAPLLGAWGSDVLIQFRLVAVAGFSRGAFLGSLARMPSFVPLFLCGSRSLTLDWAGSQVKWWSCFGDDLGCSC